jgi:hypothetical protein
MLVTLNTIHFKGIDKLYKFFAYRNENGTFYTQNRSESCTFLHHFIPFPWR